MTGRLGIDDVTPNVGDGHHPSKAVVGEVVPIGATVWREGHDAIAANVVWKKVGSDGPGVHVRMAPTRDDVDRFTATVVPDEPGLWTFRVDAWSDPWATWRHAVTVKLEAGQGPDELANDLEIGARLLQRVGRRPAERANRDLLFARGERAARHRRCRCRSASRPRSSPPSRRSWSSGPVRELITRGQPHQVYVDRTRALFGSWYEFFPRSTGGRDENGQPGARHVRPPRPRSSTAIAAMGFDVVYLPPIHPIGTVHRKGPNTAAMPGGNPNAQPGDVGSPWAIGSADGGHDAIHPELGDFDDFDAFVARARDLGMEVALDFALQCAPDHPWVAAHPEWFTVRPDGTIAYAENPPKKYQDIYPVNFDNDPAGIYAESLRVVLLWVEHGVRIFRVDNPHTKPPNFWHWLIWQVKAKYPDVLFLAEAFTRPARLFGLARLGYTQCYTLLHLAHGQAGAHRVRPHARRARRRVPAEPVRQHPGHPARVAADRRSVDVRHPGHPGRDDVADLGRLRGLRALRGGAGQAGQRGVQELREVRAAPARLRRRPERGPVAGAVPDPAQRDPPRAPRAAAAARHPLPPHRQRPGHRLLEDGRQAPATRCWWCARWTRTTPRRPTSPSTCRRWAPTGTTPSSCTTRSAGRPSTGASSRSRGWSRGAPSRTS